MEYFLGYNKKSIITITLAYYIYMVIVVSYLNMFIVRAKTLPRKAIVPAVLMFGDSVLDTGNNNYLHTMAKANFPPYGRDFVGGLCTGRFSNGKVPSDFIAEELGIKELVPPYLDPTLQINDLLTGVSFASAGSGYDNASAKSLHLLSLKDQMNLFKEYINKVRSAIGEKATQDLISQSVCVISSGSNDLTLSYFDPVLSSTRSLYNVSSYTSLLSTLASAFIRELYSLGVRNIWVISTPPCGCLPSQRTLLGGLLRQCSEKVNQASLLLNKKLQSQFSSLNKKLSGSRIIYLDAYNPLLHLIANPSQYGFEVVDKGCCGTGMIEFSIMCTRLDPTTCTDASKYLFWDSFHPTQEAYRIIVHQVMQQGLKDFFSKG